MSKQRNPLVSVLIPCFNMQDYLVDFFESLIHQSYLHFEVIVVDDGSTDKTSLIIDEYKTIFSSRNIRFKRVYQSNQGQAAAVNTALKMFVGKYLTWPDADDILPINSLKERVHFLENNPDCGFVRGKRAFFKEDIAKAYLKNEYKKYHSEDLYEDLILEKTYASGGCYLVRSDLFLSCYPDRTIYQGLGSQNWQMVLPLASKAKCGNIDEIVYFVRERRDSYSRKRRNFDEWLIRYNDHETILTKTTLSFLPNNRDYIRMIHERYAKKKMRLGFYFNRSDIFYENFYLLRASEKLNIVDRIMGISFKIKPIHRFLLYVIRKIKEVIK